jgi:hypothetical protein
MSEKEPGSKPEYFPTMSGTFMGYKPQWKLQQPWGGIFKAKKIEEGQDWTDVSYTQVRGRISVRLPDGTETPVGVPFPRHQPGILETIFMCGYEQAMALAWTFAAHMAANGYEVEVRAEEYELKYDIKAKLYEGPKAKAA